MPNVTLSIDEQTLSLGREYAQYRNVSFNSLIRTLLEQTVKPSSSFWLDEVFALADKNKGSSHGRKWTREELHRA
jgi:hypothetical protein